jgi:copper oxidase (laccase) domain-containing protein
MAGVCTSCSPDYFSYRRDGVTGRQGAFLALERA